ncbi:MAG TPA: helicase-related protein [Methylovirgula sp.]
MNIPIPASQLHPLERARGVNVVLGPTNTGKTHYAIERMLAHKSGVIGLPLRLLAREVYNRVVGRVGAEAVALITGEEKIKPKTARYWISTVEAMPRDRSFAFVAIDEIQLAANLDRGHIFTDRLLNRRGTDETLLVGASTMRRAIETLLPGAPIVARPRLSTLSFAGDRKIARLPRRTAIVAFSVEEVYAIAEWIRRQRGGAAVVLGALSPRTRNAQVDLYQNGDVDYIVATDAIGMGLNLDVDHIAFAADSKFDGWQYRRLTPAEFGQIAGRAGRHLSDGTFGTTGRCAPFEPELVEALEDHRFDLVSMLQWRNTDLDFSSIAALAGSLDVQPREHGLTRAPIAEDQMVLDIAARDEKVQRETKTSADVARLWDACQIPDYRKLSPAAHAELVLTIYGFVVRAGHIPEDWLARHLTELDRVDGDLDTLSARIAQVRTWTFVTNRPDWLRDPEHWQTVARRVEDTLSDALHERLAQRFIDRRTSVLMRRLRENAMLEAEITGNGDVMVEGQHVGHLSGFRFSLDPQAAGEAAKALNAAAQKALAGEIEGRATRVHEAVDEAFVLANDGIIRWLGEPVGKIAPGEKLLEARAQVLADEHLTGPSLELVQRRLDLWLAQHTKRLLGPLLDLEKGEGLEGIARGIAFQIAEALGVLDRTQVADDVKGLSQEARAALRKLGVRFGAYHLYLPALMKPAPRALAVQLWGLKHDDAEGGKTLDDVPHLAASGRTSFLADKDMPKSFYRVAGFRVCGERTVRVDILERLADLIRPAVAYRPGLTTGEPPPGTADRDGFVVTVGMTSLVGCSGESFASILRALGYVSEQRKGPAITVPLIAKASTEPVQPIVATETNPEARSEAPADAAETAPIEPTEAMPDAGTGTAAETDLVTEPEETIAVAAEAAQAKPVEEAAAAGTEAETDAPAEVMPAEAMPDEPAPEAVVQESSAPESALQEGAVQENVEQESIMEAEVPMIEIWRPHRQTHARRDRRPAHKQGQNTANGGAGFGQEGGALAASAKRDRNDRSRQPRGDRKPQEISAAGAEGAVAATPGEAAKARYEKRPGDARQDDKRPDQKRYGNHADKRKDETRKEPWRDASRDGTRQNRHNDERRERRPGSFTSTEKPRERDRQPDPNSPFAKLLILKQQMESQGNKN